MKSTVVIASLAACAAATFKATSHFDKFDSANPAQGLLPVASPVDGNEPGSGLYYGGWVYANFAAAGALLKPPSPNNIITTGTATQLADGRPRFLPINNTVAFFDETSIFYACFLQSEADTPVTTPCTIQAAGVKAGGGRTVVQEFVYNPSILPVGQQFNFVKFGPAFKGLSRVDFSLTSATGAENLVLPGFDSHRYVTYSEKKKW